MVLGGGRGLKDAAARWVALGVSVATFIVSLVVLGRFDPASPDPFQMVEIARWVRVDRTVVHRRHRRPQHLDAPAHNVPVPRLDPRLLDDHEGRPPLPRRDPGARDGGDRHVRHPRPAALLPVLRGAPRPDVPADRRVGRPAPHLRRDQVLPVHDGGLGVPARRDPVPVRAADGPRLFGYGAMHGRRSRGARYHRPVALPRVLRRVRGEGAIGPAAHLAARCAHRGADGGFRAPGSAPAEGRDVRADPIQPDAVPGGVEVLRRRSSA